MNKDKEHKEHKDELDKYIKKCMKNYTETDKEDDYEEKIIVTDTIRNKMIKSVQQYEVSSIVNKIAYIFLLKKDISNLNYVRFVFENVNNKNKFFNIQVYFTDSKLIESYEVEHNLFVYAFSRKFIGCFNKEITKKILIKLARSVFDIEKEMVEIERVEIERVENEEYVII